jgi:hypothetical protein
MRKTRAKAPKKSIHPQKAPKKNYFATLMDTEEGRQLRKQWSTKKRKNPGRPKGVPDGHTKESIEPLREQAKEEAIKVVEIMTKKFDIPEDDAAKEALQCAVEIIRTPGETRERLSAARLVLDFTKSKPASKSDVSISKAEDFLVALMNEDEQTDEKDIKGSEEETT